MMNPKVVANGLNETAINRLQSRFSFLEESFLNHVKVLKHGNIASLEAEMASIVLAIADLTNTMCEFVLLAKVSQQEQGQATPLNTDAPVTETPVTTTNPA